MKSTKARKKLEEDTGRLEEELAAIKKHIEEMGVKLETAPREIIEIGKQKIVVAHTDQRLEREYDDARRAQNAIEYQVREIEFLLHPSKGRERELVYQHAQQDRAANPRLTVRRLAEKYFPHYFPDRAGSAIRMMDQGLRRLTRKKTSPTNKK